MGLYDRYLALRARSSDGIPPAHVTLIITERDLLVPGAYETLEAFLGWAFEYGCERVTVYVSVLDREVIGALRQSLDSIDAPERMAVREPGDDEPVTVPIQVGIGLGGKHEFANAVAALARRVAAGELHAEEIAAADVEERLVFADEPDLVIKTGAERLSDFMIWQSVYSELYFTDVNWQNFRRRDYLRALLSYKRRSRRFGQ